MILVLLIIAPFICTAAQMDNGTFILYPRESETRDVQSLNGFWNFRISNISKIGYDQAWYKKDLSQTGEVILMPVPSSYNDVTNDMKIRDHVGLVWYDRTFFLSENWKSKRVWLRFSSITYAAEVWINGEFVMNHEVGHLPFQKDITTYLKFGKENRITVACDNMLSDITIPQGWQAERTGDDGKVLVQGYSFDFFNYAGIDRPVTLFTTPEVYITDITVTTDVEGDTGYINYSIVVKGDEIFSDATLKEENYQLFVELLDKSGNVAAVNNSTYTSHGELIVPLAILWWPYLMSPNPGYLYTMKINLVKDGKVVDVYRQPVGIRKLWWDDSNLYINNQPVYLYGFGKHEDSDIRGRGLDLALVARDYNLIKWVGANAYRTSHYPYADEIMDMADQLGIMIIDECPSVNAEKYVGQLERNHKKTITQMIKRDKNRPSVIAWSIANEPRSNQNGADNYFGNIAKHTRSIDSTRPLTAAIATSYSEDKAGQYLDIIGFNRYNSWYSNTGRLDMITSNVISEAQNWRKKYNKPVIMLEYGADTYEGLHLSPAFVWSEEYQVQMMSKHFKAFDSLRSQGWFIGEFIWNFADFKTAQSITRVGGNKKGIFTRNRQPKESAHHLRRRYWGLANELYSAPVPDDLYPYEITRQKQDIIGI